MRYRYLDDFRRGISVFAIFSYGIAVLGTPQCPPQPGPTVPQSLGVIMETNGVSWIGKQLTVQTQRSHKCIKHSEQWQIQTFR